MPAVRGARHPRLGGHRRAGGRTQTARVAPQPVVVGPLGSGGIGGLGDVRRLPGARRRPQFDADEMASWLGEAGIEYLHLTELAGRRPKQRDVDPALNAGWQNTSFKNYAD